MENALKHIVEVADAVSRRTTRFAPVFPIVASSSHVLPLDLPIPAQDSLIPELVALGAPKPLSSQLSAAFACRAKELAETHYQPTYQKTCKRISEVQSVPQPSSATYRDVFRHLYVQKLSEWAKAIGESVGNRTRNNVLQANAIPPIHTGNENKHRENSVGRFNLDYIPKLEAYFEKNQRPSRADKELIATKSGMTYRQIHVWFQNRRSRMKKLEAVNANSCKTRARESDRLEMVEVAHGDVEQRAASIRVSSSSVTLVDEDQAFKCSSPPYAFPTEYPPSIRYDEYPFPSCFGDFSTFAKPCWDRMPALVQQVQQHAVDMDSLTSDFEKLHIDDTIQRRLRKRRNRTTMDMQVSAKVSGCDVTSPYTVRPLRAPLISLIRNFASRVVHRPGKPPDTAQKSQRMVIVTPAVKNGAQSAPRKMGLCRGPALRGIPGDQNSAPSAYSPSEPTSFSAHSSPVATARVLTTDQKSKVKKSTKKPSSSHRVPAASACKDRSSPAVQAIELSSEPPIVHPSPKASVDSLPSLSYSSGSSSASTCSQSPTTSFGVLPGNDLFPSLDPYQPSGSSLTLPLAPTVFEDFPSQMFPPSDISFDFSKGPLDYTSNLGLPSYPSYSDSFDSISQGLQSSPDFPPPVLTLDSISFAV